MVVIFSHTCPHPPPDCEAPESVLNPLLLAQGTLQRRHSVHRFPRHASVAGPEPARSQGKAEGEQEGLHSSGGDTAQTDTWSKIRQQAHSTVSQGRREVIYSLLTPCICEIAFRTSDRKQIFGSLYFSRELLNNGLIFPFSAKFLINSCFSKCRKLAIESVFRLQLDV